MWTPTATTATSTTANAAAVGVEVNYAVYADAVGRDKAQWSEHCCYVHEYRQDQPSGMNIIIGVPSKFKYNKCTQWIELTYVN